METFLAFAERKGLRLAAYDSTVDALLDYQDGKYRFTEITVHPQVAVKSQDDVERARQIMESAHANCFISNSITASVNVIPEFRVMD
jgi:organic hydroperoxide reductase OsmC/OhrA